MIELNERKVPPRDASAPPANEAGAAPVRLRKPESAPSFDVVDEASWESFPASDPPGY